MESINKSQCSESWPPPNGTVIFETLAYTVTPDDPPKDPFRADSIFIPRNICTCYGLETHMVGISR